MFLGKNRLLFILLVIGTLIGGQNSQAQNDYHVPFRHRVGNSAPQNNIFHIRGDFEVIGNTNLTLANYNEEADNSFQEMRFVNIDNHPETFNSSAATLIFSE